ncbi:hypothetical protein [Parasulfitobacter algicola]|uniref:L,D-transpeptidase n=1 Tax=Parasulfitobacter algicola TaxID=2614809 RepID=A0ABX2IVV9_9RHOB|nr:hypothetical protein [Sulfitobacter algicola]NSX54504.1 hypothetical protein [Sulfitobacter algicola]
MKRLLLLFFMLFTQVAIAEKVLPSPKGMMITPRQNVVLYSGPPNAVFTQMPRAKAALRVESGGIALHPLKPDPKSGNGFVVQPATMRLPNTLIVGDYVDIWQNNQTIRWIQIKNPRAVNASKATLGWTEWGKASRPSNLFTQQ